MKNTLASFNLALACWFVLCSGSVRLGKLTSAGKKRSLENASVYVFLQRFPLKHSGDLFYHTEILVCERTSFHNEDKAWLDAKISQLSDYVEITSSWWQTQKASCVQLGYVGGGHCADQCCAAPVEENYQLNSNISMIGDEYADVNRKSLFLYGHGSFNGIEAHNALCRQICWSSWSGMEYHLLWNNCNTFTSTVLSCVYGLSQKKPQLGPSDMVTVFCKNECKPILATIE